jgi:hypothetical protein
MVRLSGADPKNEIDAKITVSAFGERSGSITPVDEPFA